MKKTFRKILLHVCSVLSLAFLCAGCLSVQATNETVADAVLPSAVTGTATESVTGKVELTSFSMRPGGSVRIKSPAGLRFMTYISKYELSLLPANAQFGTLVLPSVILGDAELTLETQSASKGTIDKWSERSTEKMYKFNSVLMFPATASAFYGVEMTARSYVTYTDSLGDTYTLYADYAQSQSIAYLASCDLADGRTEAFLYEVCDTVIAGELKWATQCTALQIGQSAQLLHDATDSAGRALKAKYQSSDACVSVSKDGVVTGVSPGTATVTATVGSYSVSTEIDVVDDVFELAGGQSAKHDFDDSLPFGDTVESSYQAGTAIISGENAILGNSLYIDNSGEEFPTVKFKVKSMLFAEGNYRVAFNYKVLSDTAPSNFYVGFNGTIQNNVRYDFSNMVDKNGTFTGEFALPAGIYYLQIFNYQTEEGTVVDSSKIVVDDIVITNVTPTVQQDLSDLYTPGGILRHNFDERMSLLTYQNQNTNDVGHSVTDVNGILGKSLVLDNTNTNPSIVFLKDENNNGKLALCGQYKVTFDYKVLSVAAPDYFCVGFNGTVQQNRENWFGGRTEAVGETYQFTHTFSLVQGQYYLQIFNLNVDGSSIVIDNIRIENVSQTPSLLYVDNVAVLHDFDAYTVLGDYESSYLRGSTVISGDNAISGNSLLLDNTQEAPTVKFLSNEKLYLSGTYRITFDYKLLTETIPNYFCVGFSGSLQISRVEWFNGSNDTVGQTYAFTTDLTLEEGYYYLQIFSMVANGSQIVIDNIQIGKI